MEFGSRAGERHDHSGSYPRFQLQRLYASREPGLATVRDQEQQDRSYRRSQGDSTHPGWMTEGDKAQPVCWDCDVSRPASPRQTLEAVRYAGLSGTLSTAQRCSTRSLRRVVPSRGIGMGPVRDPHPEVACVSASLREMRLPCRERLFDCAFSRTRFPQRSNSKHYGGRRKTTRRSVSLTASM